MLWVRMALRELRVNKGFSLFFILNLSIGLAGFIAVQSFGRSLDRHMDNNLREILTADLVLSATSPMTEEEQTLTDQVLGADKSTARLTAFYTMVRPQSDTGTFGRLPSRLVRVMAIDRAFPLYGKFVLEKKTDLDLLQKSPGLFMTRDTAHTMGLGQDADFKSPLRLGNKDFFIRDFFREDPDKSLTAVDLAPKVYMGLDQLESTGLVRFGSRIRYFYFYAFPEGTDVPVLARQLEFRFFDLTNGRPRINIFDIRDVNRRLGRLTRYFTGYMGLVSIVALFLAGMSGAYLFRGVVTLKQKDMAILMSTGAIRREIYGFVSLQLIILGALSSIVALAVSFLLMPAFPLIFKGLVPEGLVLGIDPVTVVLALALGVGGSLVFCLPAFVKIFNIHPLALLHGLGDEERSMDSAGNRKNRIWQMASFVPGLGAFFAVAMMVAGSGRDGLVFAVGFLLAMGILSVLGSLVFWWCGHLAQSRVMARFTAGKIAFRNLFRNKWSSLSCFVTIAMGVFLISLIPQIQKGLESEIMRPEGLKLPVFFLVDIQDEQTKPLADFMAGQPGELSHISPTVQGRILEVNGQPFFEKNEGKDRLTRGRGGRARGRRLEFIFSYRKSLADSETLVAGDPLSTDPWKFGSEKPFEISMAVSFADRFNLKIGDVLGFDVQGIPLTGRVKNLRKVRWNSFQPNFFLLFQDGVLNDAPKTHLGAISNVPPDQRKDLKNSLVDRFPNVSVIDVTQTATTILGVTDRLSLSVRFMAWLAIGAGLVSIFSIARHEARKNQNQINLLKVLGCDFFTLQTISLVEFGFIGFTASLFALGLSAGFSLAISWYFFDSLWQFDPGTFLAILFFSTCICMGTGRGAVSRVMNQHPIELLTGSGQ